MFALLKFFILIIVFAFLIGVFFIIALLGNAMSLFRKVKKTNQSQRTSNTYTESSSTFQAKAGQPKQKIIPKDEGEYVDFEEV